MINERIWQELADSRYLSPVAKFLDADSETFYHAAIGQITVVNNDHLNNHGKSQLRIMNERYAANEIAGEISSYRLLFDRSGFWYPDKKSKWYGGEAYQPSTFNNMYVQGTLLKNNIFGEITTSIIVLLTDNWCLTISGSLYKLVGDVSEFVANE